MVMIIVMMCISNMTSIIWTMKQWIKWLCNIKRVALSNTGKISQLPSALWMFLASFSYMFWFYSLQLYCCGQFNNFQQCHFQFMLLFFSKKAGEHIVKHLAAKETVIFLKREWILDLHSSGVQKLKFKLFNVNESFYCLS